MVLNGTDTSDIIQFIHIEFSMCSEKDDLISIEPICANKTEMDKYMYSLHSGIDIFTSETFYDFNNYTHSI